MDDVGELKGIDFGLPKECFDEAFPEFYLLDEEKIHQALPKIVRNRHKYEAGYVVGIAGSLGMFGAAKLSSLAALRSGAGIVRVFSDGVMESAPYEVISDSWGKGNMNRLVTECNRAKSVFIGPGMGRTKKGEKLLLKLLPKLTSPVVLDADALYFLASNPYVKLPKETVFTPHKLEMSRLLGFDQPPEGWELIKLTQKYCDEWGKVIVLKGAPTVVFSPEKVPMIIPRGDPGMASAGSGDVLTGMIAAFLAEGLLSERAALLGVFLHALAGELGAKENTSYCLIASDLIDALPKAFARVLKGSRNNLYTRGQKIPVLDLG